VCIFIRKEKCLNKIEISYCCKEKNLEMCTVQVETKTPNLIIISLYRAPSGDPNQFPERLDATLKYLCNPNSEFIICGDINVDCLN
jgi:exonuclease III